MKLTIHKNTMIATLLDVCKAIGKASFPVLEGVEIIATEDWVTFVTTDMKMEILSLVPVSVMATDAQVEKSGAVIVPAKRLLSIIKKMPGETISLESETNALHIKAGKLDVELTRILAEMPRFRDFKPEVSLTFKASEIRNALSGVGYAASEENSVRPILESIKLEVSTEGLLAAATDSYRLAKKRLEGTGVSETTILTPLADKMVKAVSLFHDDEIVNLLADRSVITLKSDLLQVSVRQVDGAYPDISRIIPKKEESTCNIRVDRNQFIELMERSLIMSPSQDNNVVTLFYEEGKTLKVETQCEVGSMSEELREVEGEGSIKIHFNAKLFLESVNRVKQEKLHIRFFSAETPIVMDDGEDDIHLILPIRIHANA